ncbi:MAG: DNA cytosine methyltransferase, partial [Candidatus Nanopelagicales bacterium]
EAAGGLIPEVVGILSDGAHNGGGLNGQDAYSGRILPWRCQPASIAFHHNAQASQLPTDSRDTSISDALTISQQAAVAIMQSIQVRRLTPVECERLQGFPDDYTNIPWRKKDEAPDGPRYKALGNSMAVPVMRWIGERIAKANI